MDLQHRDLRVLFVVDAMKGRNGVGVYFQDLTAQLDDRLERVALVSPSVEDPHPCQGRSLPVPGDPTQRLFVPRLRRLAALIWTMKPDVIVIPGPGLFSLAAFWMARKAGIPVCVTFQTDYRRLVRLYWGPRAAALAGGLLGLLERTLFRGSSAVATICEEMRSRALAAGAGRPQLVGTPLGEPFVRTPVTPLADRVEAVLYVGRLAAEKNIGAVLAVAANCPDCRITVVGDGPLRGTVERAARRLPNLRYLGWCDRAVVVREMDAAQVLMLPSTVEAFGTVALEAMARQRLVITTPACGINQWPSLAGLLIIQRPGESLQETLTRLRALTPAQRQARARQGRRAALAMNERTLRQWGRVLESCAHQAPALRRRPSPTLALLRRLGAAAAPPEV